MVDTVLGKYSDIHLIIWLNLDQALMNKREKKILSCRHAKLLQSCSTLCDPMDYSLPGSSVHGVLQAKYWSEVSCPLPRDLPHPGMETASPMSPALAGRFFTTSATSKYMYVWGCVYSSLYKQSGWFRKQQHKNPYSIFFLIHHEIPQQDLKEIKALKCQLIIFLLT